MPLKINPVLGKASATSRHSESLVARAADTLCTSTLWRRGGQRLLPVRAEWTDKENKGRNGKPRQ